MIVGFLVASTGMVLLSFVPAWLSTCGWLAFAAAVMGIGGGIATPAINNALLAFVPEEAGSVAGLRGMFKQAGAVITISITTAIVARSANEGVTLGYCFLAFAIAALVMVPLVFRVPNHRGTW